METDDEVSTPGTSEARKKTVLRSATSQWMMGSGWWVGAGSWDGVGDGDGGRVGLGMGLGIGDGDGGRVGGMGLGNFPNLTLLIKH